MLLRQVKLGRNAIGTGMERRARAGQNDKLILPHDGSIDECSDRCGASDRKHKVDPACGEIDLVAATLERFDCERPMRRAAPQYCC